MTKQPNSNEKNIAILVVSSSIAVCVTYGIAKGLSKAYSYIGDNLYAARMMIKTSSVYLSKKSTNNAQAESRTSSTEQESRLVELKLSHITIKKLSGAFNILMQTFFSKKSAFQFFLKNHSNDLENSDIITADPEIASQLDQGNIDLYAISDDQKLTKALAKVISVFANTESGQASIEKFLENVLSDRTAWKIADILSKAEGLKIFSAFFKAMEKVQQPDFGKLVTTLVKKNAVQEAKLTLFTKLMHSLDTMTIDDPLNVICHIFKSSDQTTITLLANLASKKKLQNLLIEINNLIAINNLIEQGIPKTIITNTIMSYLKDIDKDEAFTLTIDVNDHALIGIGPNSQGLSMIIGEKFTQDETE